MSQRRALRGNKFKMRGASSRLGKTSENLSGHGAEEPQFRGGKEGWGGRTSLRAHTFSNLSLRGIQFFKKQAHYWTGSWKIGGSSLNRRPADAGRARQGPLGGDAGAAHPQARPGPAPAGPLANRRPPLWLTAPRPAPGAAHRGPRVGRTAERAQAGPAPPPTPGARRRRPASHKAHSSQLHRRVPRDRGGPAFSCANTSA